MYIIAQIKQASAVHPAASSHTANATCTHMVHDAGMQRCMCDGIVVFVFISRTKFRGS